MAGYFRSKQEILRKNPDYKYIVEVTSAQGWLGGFDVEIQGFKLGSDDVDDNENVLHEWFWKRPARKKIMRLVDRLHQSFRAAETEQDWDAIDNERRDNLINRWKRKKEEELRREMERELARRMAEMEREAREQANKPIDLGK